MNPGRRHVLGALMTLSAGAAQAQKRELRVVYFQDFLPFSSGAGSAVSGLFVDVLNEALGKRCGVELIHRGLPWARAQDMVQQGHADAFVSLVTATRASYADAGQVSLYSSEVHAYAAADHPQLQALRAVTDPSDFKGRSIATYIGNSLADSAFAHMNVRLASTAEGSVQMALTHRVDLVPGEDTQMRHYLKSLGVSTSALVRLDPPLGRLEYFLQIRKNYADPGLVAEGDKTLRAMRADGTLGAMIARYQN